MIYEEMEMEKLKIDRHLIKYHCTAIFMLLFVP